MTAPDFPPGVIEKAARELHEISCADDECDGSDMGSYEHDARAVLAAVADDLRAEGARAEAALWQAQVRGHDRSGVMALDREAAYQRGMAKGARQVREAVEALVAGWERDAGPGSRAEDVYGRQVVSVEFAVAQIRTAAREAVASIEKGGE